MELVSHANIDEQLLALIADRKAREVLWLALIDRYSPSRREAVLLLCRDEEAIGRREQYDESGDTDTAERVAESIRVTAFGRVVRRAYDYTCAMCGVRFMLDDVILVDAAHLIPFAKSHDAIRCPSPNCTRGAGSSCLAKRGITLRRVPWPGASVAPAPVAPSAAVRSTRSPGPTE